MYQCTYHFGRRVPVHQAFNRTTAFFNYWQPNKNKNLSERLSLKALDDPTGIIDTIPDETFKLLAIKINAAVNIFN